MPNILVWCELKVDPVMLMDIFGVKIPHEIIEQMNSFAKAKTILNKKKNILKGLLAEAENDETIPTSSSSSSVS